MDVRERERERDKILNLSKYSQRLKPKTQLKNAGGNGNRFQSNQKPCISGYTISKADSTLVANQSQVCCDSQYEALISKCNRLKSISFCSYCLCLSVFRVSG